jgi:hypothetical protein
MDDNRDIAFLAASCEREMRQSLNGSSIRYNRTDFRKFLGNEGQNPNIPYPQQVYAPQINPQQVYQQMPVHPQFEHNNNPIDHIIPEGVLSPSDQRFVPLPQNFVPPTQYANPSTNISSTNSFEMPNYNIPSKNYLEDEKQFRDALIEEIKSLKNNIKSQKTQINKLIKEISSVKLLLQNTDTQLPTDKIQPLTEDIINDNTDQS